MLKKFIIIFAHRIGEPLGPIVIIAEIIFVPVVNIIPYHFFFRADNGNNRVFPSRHGAVGTYIPVAESDMHPRFKLKLGVVRRPGAVSTFQAPISTHIAAR